MGLETDPRRPERDQVDLDNPEDVESWTTSLGISREDLARAVAAVGTSTGKVYDYFGRHRATDGPADARA